MKAKLKTIKCEKCGHDISVLVDRQFMDYTIDKIVCPNCQKHQSRYISLSDLLLYLLLTEISYLVLCSITTLFFNLFNKSLWSLTILVPFLFLNLLLQKHFGRTIYADGLYKKEFKDFVFKEDVKLCRTSIKYRVVIFFTVSVSILTLSQNTFYLLVFVVLSVIETAFRYFQQLKKEKALVRYKDDL